MKLLIFFLSIAGFCLADEKLTLGLYAVHPNGSVFLESGMDHPLVQRHAKDYRVLERPKYNGGFEKILVTKKPVLKIEKIEKQRILVVGGGSTGIVTWTLPKEAAKKIDEAKHNPFSRNLVVVLGDRDVLLGRVPTSTMYGESQTVNVSDVKFTDLPEWSVKLDHLIEKSDR